MIMMHGHTSKDPIMQELQQLYHQQQCKSPSPFTLINSTTIALSSIHVHTINQIIIQLRVIITLLSTYININSQYTSTFHILHNQVKWHNTSFHDKYHIQPSTIIHISSITHIKLFMKDL
jgi:hypothetical protein